MKKLLDENPDDLTRALLQAGRSQRPPAGNQTKLLVALGVGTGLGLFSSKAFAWLGTSGGKLTLIGVTLGIAGAAYVALPATEPRGGAAPQQLAARLEPAATSEHPSERPSERAPAAPVRSPAPAEPADVPVIVPAHADAPVVVATSSATSSSGATAVPARRAHAPAASEWRRRTAEQRGRIAARRDNVSQAKASQAKAHPVTAMELAGPLPAASAPPPAVGALGSASATASSSAVASGSVASGSVASGLETEIQLVDAMRGAAQRNDTAALRRLVESYRGEFPAGQLRQEVAELALRALPPAH